MCGKSAGEKDGYGCGSATTALWHQAHLCWHKSRAVALQWRTYSLQPSGVVADLHAHPASHCYAVSTLSMAKACRLCPMPSGCTISSTVCADGMQQIHLLAPGPSAWATPHQQREHFGSSVAAAENAACASSWLKFHASTRPCSKVQQTRLCSWSPSPRRTGTVSSWQGLQRVRAAHCTSFPGAAPSGADIRSGRRRRQCT